MENKTGLIGSTFEQMSKIFDRFLSAARAEACFGDPVQVGDTTIIPAADVMAGIGFGLGFGEGEERRNEQGDSEEADSVGKGGGGGGGGGIRSRSVAVIAISRDRITVEPVVDATQIAMAGIAATAFVGFWLIRLMKGAESAKGDGPSLKSVMKTLTRA